MAEPLRAGDLTAVLTDGPELRDLRFGGAVVLDGIALTVRDPDWATVPGHRLDRTVTATDSGVRVADRWRFDVGAGRLLCHLDLGLAADGEVSVALQTEVVSPAAVNRAGLVLLHPIELAGRPVTLRGPDGPREDRFPVRVSPFQPFRDLRGMAYAPADGLAAEIDFGDAAYETEDHRNWSDAGWKSYTPPLAEPVPVRLAAGDRRGQRLAIHVSGRRPSADHRTADSPEVRLFPDPVGVRPAIGWGAGPQPAGSAADLPVRPDFLAVEVLATPLGRERLQSASTRARALDVPLRVTAAVRAAEAAAVVAALAAHAGPISHVCLVDPDTHVSDEALVRTARTALAGRAVAVGAGTRGYLAELGRSAAGLGEADFVQLSLSAEVHHDDDERILATTRAMPAVVASARALAGDRPLVVAPLTLAERLSVHRPESDRYAPWDPAVPPDPRSGGRLGAAWVLAAVAGLVGVEAVGCFALAPGHGLVDPAGRPTAAATVLAGLSSAPGRSVLRCAVSDPRRVAALALGDDRAAVLHLVNLTAADLTVQVVGTGTPGPVTLAPYAVRRLEVEVPARGDDGSTMDV